jgi:hypothetical protein
MEKFAAMKATTLPIQTEITDLNKSHLVKAIKVEEQYLV